MMYARQTARGLAWALMFCVSTARGQSATQKFSLGAPGGPRFTVPDIQWPANHGDADVCLWENDKIAAYTITIDDNCAANVPWWLAQGDAFGFRFTWFLITGIIPSDLGGTWSLWRQVFAKGHAVQSHTVAHGDDALFQQLYGKSYTQDWYDYYYGAIKMIQDSIPGNQCITLAYPGLGTNNPEAAMQHYVACRGLNTLQEKANQFDFTGINLILEGDVNSLLATTTKTGTIFGRNVYRSWACTLLHWLDANGMSTEQAWLNYLKANEEGLWISTFPDVVRYNMEYATQKLTKREVTTALIRYALTDSMADSIYTYPLTIKVRLNNDWQTVQATQNGTAIPCSTFTHSGNLYTLIKAVPDRGEIRLEKGGSTGLAPLKGRPANDLKKENKVTVFDMSGAMIGSGVIDPEGMVSNEVINGLPAGIYLYKTDGAGAIKKRLWVW